MKTDEEIRDIAGFEGVFYTQASLLQIQVCTSIAIRACNFALSNFLYAGQYHRYNIINALNIYSCTDFTY